MLLFLLDVEDANHISSKNPHPFAKIKEMDCHELCFNSAL